MEYGRPLPIDAHLGTIVRLLEQDGGVVVEATPGAGKTTRVPRALLEAGLAQRGSIVVLEPRRLAARLAAERVAAELGQQVGIGGENVVVAQRVDAALMLKARGQAAQVVGLLDQDHPFVVLSES